MTPAETTTSDTSKSAGPCTAVILAAGEGTRMRSARPKVLHAVAGLSMVGHVAAAAHQAGADRIAVVVGPGREDVASEVRRLDPFAQVCVQTERRGTAHALLAAREMLVGADGPILVLFGDTPLLQPDTLAAMRDAVSAGAAVAALGFEARDPAGYGRLLLQDGQLVAIREHKDASEAERRVTLCNAGVMALDGRQALSVVEAIGNANAQAEFYLTDAVAVARARGLKTVALTAPEDEVMGVNDRVQLAAAEAVAQRRLRERVMREGATLVAPETVFLTHDTRLGRDVLVEPHVVFGPGVVVEDGAVIHAFSHLEGAMVGPGASVGPYGRLRPGADLRKGARVGNFVEIKNAVLGEGAKVNHLTYVGDASVGARANLGAGTITCNYDGFSKFRTVIGDDAFVGSNSALVAPVTIGDGAYVGSGSVVTRDVPADSLAIARGRQSVIDGWAKSFRDRQIKKKDS
jgi:bifunctional UDP-N-acetylglucosamine pyrophosphorylase/glucosamine-1-phosphate N-acetyltransferase